MAISFPSNPTLNQTYTYLTVTYVYDGKRWASTLPSNANSVSTASIMDGAVTAVKLAPGAAVPSQTGNSGKYLTTDGSTATWGTVNSLPTQTSNSGKYLTTDGTNAAWSTVSTTPADGSITPVKIAAGTTGFPISVGNTSQRAASPTTGLIRINSELNSLELYSGSQWNTIQYLGYITATGGVETYSGNYKIHTFLSSATFQVVTAPSNATVEYLVVAGGGGGGSDMGGGGGAGGVLATTGLGMTSGSYSIIVGAGGQGAPAGQNQVRGTNGVNSSISSSVALVTALGGGGGASEYNNNSSPAGSGGSGGGAAGSSSTSYGLGTPGQGYNGSVGQGDYYPGGGGGAGGPGSKAPANGGIGVVNAITGTSYYWGGGGGGAGYSGVAGNGGLGGGGGGGPKVSGGGLGDLSGLNPGQDGAVGALNSQTNVPGGNGGTNTGGGGGGGAHMNTNNYGGTGGSGIVVIRYRYQ